MRGLITYLAGPGRHNEHADQHVVAGDEWTELRFMDAGLDRPTVAQLAEHLDAAVTTSGRPMKGGHEFTINSVLCISGIARWPSASRTAL